MPRKPLEWSISPCNTELGFAEPNPARPVQVLNGDELLRGFVPPIRKSFALSLVSKQPSSFLRAAVVFESSRRGPEPSKQFVVRNQRNRLFRAPVGQSPVNDVVLLTTATLPEVELTVMVPTASGVGRSFSAACSLRLLNQEILTRLKDKVWKRSYLPGSVRGSGRLH